MAKRVQGRPWGGLDYSLLTLAMVGVICMLFSLTGPWRSTFHTEYFGPRFRSARFMHLIGMTNKDTDWVTFARLKRVNCDAYAAFAAASPTHAVLDAASVISPNATVLAGCSTWNNCLDHMALRCAEYESLHSVGLSVLFLILLGLFCAAAVAASMSSEESQSDEQLETLSERAKIKTFRLEKIHKQRTLMYAAFGFFFTSFGFVSWHCYSDYALRRLQSNAYYPYMDMNLGRNSGARCAVIGLTLYGWTAVLALLRIKSFRNRVGNFEALGDDTVDKAVRKQIALHEPAWQGVGSVAGVLVWRVQGFNVFPVSADDYGKFHKGAAYIVLNTLPPNEEGGDCTNLFIHYLVGSEMTEDEQGFVFFKTVELYDCLDGEQKMMRETIGEESPEFKALFEASPSYLDGRLGGESRPDAPEDRDWRFYILRPVMGEITAILSPPLQKLIADGDSYVLETQEKIYIYNSDKSSDSQKTAAKAKAEEILQQRTGDGVVVTSDIDDGFWLPLG